MSDITKYTNGSKHPKHFFATLKYKILFARNNPDYFYPSGIWVFCGPQGSGKTLSAVKCLKEMLRDYPKAMVVSNLEIKGLEHEVIPFTDYDQLKNLSNGIYGIIFLLDEIHVLWNSLESKEIPISEMACFCQMRKDRRVIIGTSQVYGRIAKPIREQLQYIVDCKNFFQYLQFNTLIDPAEAVEKDGQIEGKIIRHQFWLHTPELYGSYDTLFKITKAERKEMKNNGSSRSRARH